MISCYKGRSNSSESEIERNCFWHEIFWLHNRISLFIDSLLFNSEAHYFYRTERINTGGKKRAAPSTRHAARLATSFDPVRRVKFAAPRGERRCSVSAGGREACEAISESFSRPLHRQSFYGMLTRLILVSAREVHLFLIPASSLARK